MMRTKKLLAALLLLVTCSLNVMTAQQMPPIPVDPAVRIGKLDCGLTYYIRHNNYPEHRVNFYIAQRVGSIQEEESQRGLAHFLEHMAFNGSEHFNGEGKSIIDYTRSLGVAFGEDLNAYTGIAQTVYNINDVPSTRPSAIDSCLLILKDWSGGLLLTDEEIDKERGVIHEEWRMGQGPEMRMLERQLENMYPGSKYGKRFPIGLMSVVDNFEYKELRDYYHKWYRPDNQALVIVGDVDVDHVEAQIRELFKDCVLDPNAAQVVDEPVGDNEEPIIIIDKDKEQQYCEVTIMLKHEPYPKKMKGYMDYMIHTYLVEMGTRMFNTRLREMALEPDAPFDEASCSEEDYFLASTKAAFMLDATPKDGQAEATTQALITEALRAAKFGFTETEYTRAREEYLSILEKMYNDRNTISNEMYGRSYCNHYLNNEPIIAEEKSYQLMSMIAPSIRLDQVNKMMSDLIKTDGRNMVILNLNQEKDETVYPTVEGFKDAIAAANSADVTPYVDNVKNEPLMTELPKPGKIVRENYNETFGYKELELSNGSRVILKKTDFKEDEILMMAQQRGGQSLYGEKDHANLELLNELDSYTGVAGFSKTELEKALAGKRARVYYDVGSYSDQIAGNTTVKDLETMLQLVYLKFTALNADEKKFNQTMNMTEKDLKNKDLNPESALSDTLQYIMGNYSWRNKPLKVEDLKQVSLDRIMEIARERTTNAANFNFVFVGNFDEAVIRPLIEQYIASLPGNKGKKSNWGDIPDMPSGQVINHFTKKMEMPKAFEIVIWHNNSLPYNLETSIKTDMLGQVLSRVYLQKIREDAGAAYTTQAMGQSGMPGGKSRVLVLAVAPVNPDMIESSLNTVNEEMVNACTTIDATALNEIKENLLKNWASNLKLNSYWRNIITMYLNYGVDEYTGYEDIVKAQTPETIAAFARQLCEAGNKIEVVMAPEQ